MVPPWAEPSPELLNSFTEDTGIRVTMNIVGWDDIRNKVSIAAVGNKAPADVIEVDWSWVGEFGAAGWFEPIILTDEEKAGMPTAVSYTHLDVYKRQPYGYRLPVCPPHPHPARIYPGRYPAPDFPSWHGNKRLTWGLRRGLPDPPHGNLLSA